MQGVVIFIEEDNSVGAKCVADIGIAGGLAPICNATFRVLGRRLRQWSMTVDQAMVAGSHD